MPFTDFIKKEQIDISKNVWVFGYGSLMWKPGFDFIEKKSAHLCGYHRRFCVYSMDHRGTTEQPGLVLGLDSGGSCNGVAFKIKGSMIKETFKYLWGRESGYTPRYHDVWIDDKKQKALFFAIDRDHHDFCDITNINEMIDIILESKGNSGTNLEYAENTLKHLQDLDIQDVAMSYFWNQLQKRLSDIA